jgi:hypothetical protein
MSKFPSKFAITVLLLAAGASALAAVPMVTPANAVTHSTHIKKHLKKHQWVQRGPVFAEPSRQAPNNPTYQAWPGGRAHGGAGHTCFRGIDCAQWPPPVEEDPDRKTSGEGI